MQNLTSMQVAAIGYIIAQGADKGRAVAVPPSVATLGYHTELTALCNKQTLFVIGWISYTICHCGGTKFSLHEVKDA